MTITSIISAFAGGILSFLSPCIIPVLPGYLSVIALENRDGGKKHRVVGALFFGAGFTAVFILLGLTAVGAGKLLNEYKFILSRIMGIIVLLMGLHILNIININFLYSQIRINMDNKTVASGSILRPFIIGFAFALGWTPCVGPLLGGILSLAATHEHFYQGGLLLLFYSAGLWLPFILTAFFTNKILDTFRKYPKFVLYSYKISGVFLVILGLIIATGKLNTLSSFFI